MRMEVEEATAGRHAKAKAAAGAEGEAAPKKPKTAAVERMVVDGKRMVKKPMSMEKVRRVLAISPTPVVVHPRDAHWPLISASKKLCQFGIDKIRELQDTFRHDLETQGYVLGWATDDDEE